MFHVKHITYISMQNPIGEADLEWILYRNCESTEQLQFIYE